MDKCEGLPMNDSDEPELQRHLVGKSAVGIVDSWIFDSAVDK